MLADGLDYNFNALLASTKRNPHLRTLVEVHEALSTLSCDIINIYIYWGFFPGPTFVIVEYCEHGSLLCYLRNSRLEENGYVNQRYKPSRHLSNQQREPPELLTIRDLLSFAWQTAKGMQYLSEIKVSITFVFLVTLRPLPFSSFRKKKP